MSEINWGLIATAFRTRSHIAAITELKRQGYVIVPVVPTAEMIDAAVNTKGQDGELLSDYMRHSLGNAIAAGEVTA